MKKNIAKFATPNVDDLSQPAPAASNNSSKSPQVVDPEERAARNRKIIKWIVLLICLGLIGVIIYFACFAGAASKVSPTDISVTQNEMKVNEGNDEYVVSDYTNHKNAWANPYVVYANSNAFYVYLRTNHGTICFIANEDYGDSTADNYFAIGNKTYTSGSNVFNALSYITNSAEVKTESPWLTLLIDMIPTLLFLGIMVWMMFKMMKMQGGGAGDEQSIFTIGKSQAKLTQSNVRFSDVAGIEEEKAELIEIVDYLKNPEKYAAMGARTPRGVILYGPPGTGKTLLAKAVAGEAKVPFFQVSGSAFEDMLVGVGAKRVRDLFLRAKKSAPSIIFIDELDSVASKRGKNDVLGGGGGIADQTINQLLAEMDGFSTKTGVVVMAATNRLDVLDDAILRPGRFDRHIQVNLPDIKEREAILKIHAKNKNISASVNLEDIARRTPGFSGAQLENVLNEATLLAVRFNKSSITTQEIDEAIDRVIAGPAKHSRVITESEKKQIAYHEAGHALVGLHTPGSDVVEKITIIPRGQAAGYTLSAPEKQEIRIQKKSDLLSIITGILGGRAAEEVIYGKSEISTGAANDLYKVTNIVRAMVTQLGMTNLGMTQYVPSEGTVSPYAAKLYSEKTAQRIDDEINDIICTQYEKAKAIIAKNRKELDLIVEALIILETIVKNQIDYIHKNLALPQEALERKRTTQAAADSNADKQAKTPKQAKK
ncbi:MAG: ATP-dependent zinc metalloprotease FtsH [Mycoplasmataceae bacterium]|nr:ATP-dependent zinc metalloprotease FtsH [Mycoplasmataceae bacterium]